MANTLHLLTLCRLAHHRCPPPLPAGPGGAPRTYREESLLLIALLRTLWRLSYQDGLQGVKEFFAGWLATFPDTAVTVEDAFRAGNKVVGRYTYHANHQGFFLGIPTTGKQITVRSIDIWRVQNGMFVEHWDELNLLEVMRQLGAVPSL